MAAIVVDEGASYVLPPAPVSFTTSSLSSPNRVVAVGGGVSAVFSFGARTVAVSGLQRRTFTETKRVGVGTKDDFARVRSSRWGLSPCYGVWSSPVGGLDSDWTVDGTAAKVLVNTAGVSRYTTLRDVDVLEYVIRAPVSLSTMPAGANNGFSLVGNYVDTDTHYRYRLTFTPLGLVQLSIDRVEGGTAVVVAAALQVGTGYVAGQEWWIEGERAPGGVVRCRAWVDGAAPPAGWQQTYTDPTPLGPGRVGIRAFLTTGATNTPTYTVREFEISSGRWGNPPAVTHDTWVRVLPSVFAGWDNSVRDWLRDAVVDTSPDVLARAASFITGAVAVVDPSYGVGRGQVLGQALYGPNAADGGRIEGADFNDYIRTSWGYPNLVTPSTDINELDQQFCLDCSGLVRMVFGYWHGLPMSLLDPADATGFNIPRRAVLIGPSGPGVLLASSTTDGTTTTPPPLATIQVGDVVSFDADLADNTAGEEGGDVESTDDHVGIYLGRDAGGHYLFISSRKTANGPTFGAVGGNSWLDGTGMWAASLRHIRRF